MQFTRHHYFNSFNAPRILPNKKERQILSSVGHIYKRCTATRSRISQQFLPRPKSGQRPAALNPSMRSKILHSGQHQCGKLGSIVVLKLRLTIIVSIFHTLLLYLLSPSDTVIICDASSTWTDHASLLKRE